MSAPTRVRGPSRTPRAAQGLRDLPLDGEGPIYAQIYRALRDAILSGRVRAGMRLPPTRVLAEELGVSRNTVLAAFEPLAAEGYVVSRVGAGTFVAPQVEGEGAMPRDAGGSRRSARIDAKAPPAREGAGIGSTRISHYGQRILERGALRDYDRLGATGTDAIDFRPCVPDLARLNYEPWRRELARTAHHAPTDRFDYANPSGLLELREAIASYLARARGVRTDPDRVVIVGGVAQALDLATRLLVDPGEAVLVEDPHYLGARRHFEAAGVELVGAPVDGDGLDLEAVDPERLARCRLAYVTPSHQYPTGVVMSLARRQALLRWAEASSAFLFEDDYDSEFRYTGRAIPSLASLDERDRVLYVGTFSKTLLPSLRIAYLVLPPDLVEVFRAAKWLADWAAPTFEQQALARLLASGEFERHLRRARTLYAEGRAALVEAIRAELMPFGAEFRDSGAGLHLLVRFEAIDSGHLAPLLRAAAAAGLALYPAAPSYLEVDPRRPLELVFGFARLAPDAIRQGIRRLASLLADL